MVTTELSELKTTGDQNPNSTFTLAHLSDLHMSCVSSIRFRELLNKRLYGYIRWKLLRAAEHREKILAVLQADLLRIQPDHIAVTGDLTHLSLPAEFRKARDWLQSLGSPLQVTVIPGNHDAYVKGSWRDNRVHWLDYMLSDNTGAAENGAGIFPILRVRGPVALIGVCTARPSAPHLAVGSIGALQIQKLASLLTVTAQQQLFRVMLIHHPPAPGTVNWRKRLTDAASLQALLERHGSELILHGHAHRHLQNFLKTPAGKVPVMGASSASALGRTLQRRARYYIYRITPGANGWDVRVAVRIYSPDENRFILESEHQFD